MVMGFVIPTKGLWGSCTCNELCQKVFDFGGWGKLGHTKLSATNSK